MEKTTKQEKSKSNPRGKQKNGKGASGELTIIKKATTANNKFIKPKGVQSLKLTPQRQRMINESVNALISSNFNKERASQLLDISVQALYGRFKRYPQIKEQADFYNKQTIELARQKIDQFADTGADNVINLATDSRSEKVKLDANLELLDRAGITKPQAINQINILNDLRKDKDNFNL